MEQLANNQSLTCHHIKYPSVIDEDAGEYKTNSTN